METIKAINECSAQVMFFVLSIAATAWLSVGIVEAFKFAAKEWFKPTSRPVVKPGGEALNGAKQ